MGKLIRLELYSIHIQLFVHRFHHSDQTQISNLTKGTMYFYSAIPISRQSLAPMALENQIR